MEEHDYFNIYPCFVFNFADFNPWRSSSINNNEEQNHARYFQAWHSIMQIDWFTITPQKSK